jgi:hypothetical protein
MLTKRLRTGYDIYSIQSEHVVYRTYSRQPINSFLPILKVMCGINPKNPANFTRGLFNKGENNTLWLQGIFRSVSSFNFHHFFIKILSNLQRCLVSRRYYVLCSIRWGYVNFVCLYSSVKVMRKQAFNRTPYPLFVVGILNSLFS